jgi:hypothetical protein
MLSISIATIHEDSMIALRLHAVAKLFAGTTG